MAGLIIIGLIIISKPKTTVSDVSIEEPLMKLSYLRVSAQICRPKVEDFKRLHWRCIYTLHRAGER